MQLVFALSLFLFSAVAFAKNDPRFSFPSAEKAFNEGVAPDASTLVGKWHVVGSASGNGGPDEYTGYWPDGKTTDSSYQGHFYDISSIEEKRDAFGQVTLNLTRVVIGVESKKVYSTEGPVGGILSAGSYDYQLPRTKFACAIAKKCRMAGEFLLCAARVVDRSSGCNRFPQNIVTRYLGYQRH